MKMNKIKNIIEMINPTFYKVWLAKENHLILKGGRSSTKSSVVSLKLVVEFLKDDQANIICLRKVAKYLRTSVYEQIKWAIYELGVESEFTFGSSPLVITHNLTGTGFYFYGVDDPTKLKSAKIAKGYVSHLWFEELAEFSGQSDIDVVEDTFIRQKLPDNKEVKIYFTYNPPRNPYEWINEWVDYKKLDNDYLIHHSTFLDDIRGFLSSQMIEKINKVKEIDIDYYKWMYMGDVIGLGDLVYNIDTFTPINGLNDLLKETNDGVRGLFLSSDTGHQVSASTTLALALTRKGNIVLLDTYYYSPAGKVIKKPPTEISKDMYEFRQSIYKRYPYTILKETIDSAEGAIRNQYYSDYGIKLNPVAKSKKAVMIDYAINIFAEGRFYYVNNKNNKIFIEEHKKYQWKEDTIASSEPKVIEVDDHTCDAFQYFVKDNLRILGLKY